ncbi:polysaccharide biosynthesis/export family protein [Rubellimicrobium aerolatum]|uniref:Polysaccharide biosynthesis/export family protein n=1 Tax=Rubellimicrobium aerolatum TaxID=490979 RepID=A0ABW0S967_9RHOB|nr:polysaccharide biosynthesis/export family protein [Rubellimicrobium aerolatum]MBP1804828.1 polysaccharide export outer membrane protein [Rubellimicrobium aerolatum]
MQIAHSTRRALLASTLALGLGGCGVSYVSPLVRDTASDNVDVVEITGQSIAFANSAPYTPRGLPEVFSRTAGSGGGLRGAGALPEAPAVPQAQPGPLDLRPPPETTPPTYRIGVGDVVQLATRVARPTGEAALGEAPAGELRQTYTVRDDGAIAIPDVGAVEIGGLTIEEAEQRVFERFIETGADPDFSLEIAGFNSQGITVGGDVAAPTRVPVTLNVPTLDEALTAAGGLQVTTPEFASIRVYRDGTLYQIPLADYDRDGRLRSIQLLPGDSVFVDTAYDLDRALAYYTQQINAASLRRTERTAALEELQAEVGLRRDALDEERALFRARDELGAVPRDYVYLTGEVTQQRRYALPFGQQATLADALFDQGGFETETGNPSQIYVLRATPGEEDVTAWHLDARSAANLTLATRFELRPNDIVFIEEQPITRWNRAFQQFFPSLVTTASSAVD